MKTIILVLTASLLFSNLSLACLHFSEKYKSELREGLQQVLLFHDGKNAHMIVRTNLESNKFPTEIAWVIPFPSLPSKYEEVASNIFEDIKVVLYGAEDTAPVAAKADEKGVPQAIGRGIKVHDKIDLDTYEIQPIEILSDGSGNEFNNWLTKNKFNSMPLKNQKFYLKKGAVFLAIRLKVGNLDKKTLVFNPLHIIYPSDKLSLPIKFTHDSREFDLDLYVFSKKELNKDLSQMYLRKYKSAHYEKGEDTPYLNKLIGNEKGFITQYSAYGLNKNGQLINKLATDPEFTIKDLN